MEKQDRVEFQVVQKQKNVKQSRWRGGKGGGGDRGCLDPANAGHAEEHPRPKAPDVKGGLEKSCRTAWESFLADKPRGPGI